MRLSAFLLAAVAALLPRAGSAETFHTCVGFIDALPAVLTSQGVWCLRQDLATSLNSGFAIEVKTNNVTIDCNGFKIGGLGGGENMAEVGIAAYDRRRIGVRDCTIRGFDVGIDLRGSDPARGGHRVEDNQLDFQPWLGIRVSGHDSIVRRNQLLSIGGSAFDEYAAAIHTGGDVDILDNTIADMLPARPAWEPDIGDVYAIVADDNGHGTIAGNRIRRIARNPSIESEAWAIRLSDSQNAIVEGNRLANPDGLPAEEEVGAIRCTGGFAYLRDNIARSFSGPAHGCTDGGGNTGL